MNKVILTSIEKVKPIKLFDILIEDAHSASETPNLSPIDSTIGLTYHEVLEWITHGGDWNFSVTEHKNPDNVFMSGSTWQDMNAARKGEESFYVGEISQAELSDIRKIIDMKRAEIKIPNY